MELCSHECFEAPFSLRSAGRARVQLPATYRCFCAFRQCWKKTWVYESFAISSQRNLLSLKSIDSPALRASLQSADHPSSQARGKHHKFSSVSSPSTSNAPGASRNKEAAIVREQRHHSHSSESAKCTTRQAGSGIALTSRSGSKDISAREHITSSRETQSNLVVSGKTTGDSVSAREYSSKRASSRETLGNPVVSSKTSGDSVLGRGSTHVQVWSRASSSQVSVDPGLFEKGSGSSVSFKGSATNKKLPSHKSEASRATFSLGQLKEEKVEKFEEFKKQKAAMAEANGFRLSKRAKKNPEESQLATKLNQCSKHGDLHGALAVYDMVKKGQIFNLKQHHYNVLLYICSGAAAGSISSRKNRKDEKVSAAVMSDVLKRIEFDPEESTDQAYKGDAEDGTDLDVVSFGPEDRQLAAKRGTEIYEDMLQSKIPPNEATFTSVARLAVAKGDGDLAFETVKKMASANITPKLRSYGPALLCFCESNQAQKAFEVDDHMVAAGIPPDENLLEAMLKVSIAAGLDKKIYSLLQRLRTTVSDVSPATVMTIERWFTSGAAAVAGKTNWDKSPSKEEIKEAAEAGGGGWHGLGWLGKGTWSTKRTNISKSGVCLNCGETLCTIDLDLEETDKFAKSVADLAMQRETNSQTFLVFQEWLKENGPFEAVLDGANIGMYNSALRGFNYNQVATVASAVKARNSTVKPPLIVLHRRRTLDGAPRSPRSCKIIEGWISNNNLYSTPHGSNDDWYWLYAAVSNKCFLVTNDEMRDHLFELLGNNFFPKWKERHQVRFTFSASGLELLMPPPYSTVIQESQTGSWHIPQVIGDDVESPREWLCVTRSQMDLSQLKSAISVEKEPLNGQIMDVNVGKDSVDDPKTSCTLNKGPDAPPPSACKVELGVCSATHETYLKLEAAEKLSNTTITYDI